MKNHTAVVGLMFVGLMLFLSACAAADEKYDPKVAAASKDAELALQSFVIPEGVSASLLAAEPALANPVAFYVANDGKVYVCETFRQEVGVEDNRSHMDWLNNDLRLESVEERLAMFKKYLGDDVKKYATEHDRVRVLQDTNGDGKFDSDKVFAQGFNDILDGTGAGVIEHDGKVYYTCIPKLWMLEDADGDGQAEKTDALHHGYGVRVAFRGHDMHGLTVGPDGRLYFSIGDRGYNVITQEGSRLKRVDSGAVFRCEMDGSHLEVFAYGLRNPQELAFDDHGNLWTGDNNSDSGDQARWVYIVQDGDTGWRMYFQYEEDRGPWNRERMWYPYRSDDETTAVQPAYIVPPVANLGDGPSGLTYYPGIGMSDRYKNHFFMADFRGGASNSGIRSFSVKPKGASFELTDSHQFIWSILGTDVDFAPDGSLYVTDWVNGWVGEGKGRLYRFADDNNISAVTGANVPELLNGGIAGLTTDDLLAHLGHADRRVRQKAQFELVKRNAVAELKAATDLTSDGIEQRHIAWAMWQLGRASADQAKDVAQNCVKAVGAKGDLGVQYIKVLTDIVKRHGFATIMTSDVRDSLRTELASLTNSEDLRHAGFAVVALGAIGRSEDSAHVFNLLRRNNNEDAVVRHQASMALTSLLEREPALAAQGTLLQSSPAKLGLVLAMARLQHSNLAQLLDGGDAEVVDEAARAIHEHNITAGYDQLAQLAESMVTGGQSYSEPTIRRSIEMLYRSGLPAAAKTVAAVASDRRMSDDVRLVATNMLLTWNDPKQTDTVNGRWRPLPMREVEGIDNAIREYLPGMLAGPDAVRDTTIQLAAKLGINDVVPALNAILSNQDADPESRVASFKALAKLSTDVDALLANGRTDSSEGVRIAALQLLAERSPAEAVPTLTETVQSGSVKAQQMAISLLGNINNKASQASLAAAFQQLNSASLPNSLALDLLKAAEASGTDELKALVTSYRTKQAEAGTPLAAWSDCLDGGNAEQGKVVFFGRAAASCRRCHKVNGSGADVGPDLSAIAKDKDRSYLLESIVDPNAKIAKGFETTIIVDIDGKIHAGIIKEENDNVVKLMSPQGAIITVAKDDIDERAKGQSGMPSDLAKNLSRDEVRDLVAYLATLKVAETTAHGQSGE